jgi:hypothetical protein
VAKLEPISKRAALPGENKAEQKGFVQEAIEQIQIPATGFDPLRKANASPSRAEETSRSREVAIPLVDVSDRAREYPAVLDPYTGDPLRDYNAARGMGEPFGEAWLFAHYADRQILSCANPELARKWDATLVFEPNPRGEYMAIWVGHRAYVFPQLHLDYLSARRSLEPVFSFPEGRSGKLALQRPAGVVLTPNAGFILKERGVIEVA